MNQTLSLHQDWSVSRKISFRFISVFFFFNIFPFPLYFIPKLGTEVSILYANLWTAIDDWAASTFFGLDELSSSFSGSGDSSLQWIHLLMVVLISVIIGTIWSVLDRKRQSYAKLWRWFHLIIVYHLAMFLYSYGFIKALGEQFGNIGIARMLSTYGESSPMRLLWTFMSASEAFITLQAHQNTRSSCRCRCDA
jgi:hypothetical protein